MDRKEEEEEKKKLVIRMQRAEPGGVEPVVSERTSSEPHQNLIRTGEEETGRRSEGGKLSPLGRRGGN